MKPETECKKINGRIICKFESGLVTSTVAPIDPIQINVYTSKQCGWCDDAISIVKRVTNPFKEVVNLNVIDVDDGCDDCDDIEILPTINIGRGKNSDRIVGIPKNEAILSSVFSFLGNNS